MIVMLNMTITIGNVLEIISILVGGIVFLLTIKAKLDAVIVSQDSFRLRLDAFDGEIKHLTKMTSALPVQNEKLSSFDQRITGHGERITKLEERLDEKVNNIYDHIDRHMSQLESRLTDIIKSPTIQRRKKT